ncbi:MAG: hypothetical protein QOJ74_457, partial [Ilumatobacteraceae bacterium]|nr:hypothetical protein [Ilumatobacteraceae bacterium]
SGESTKLIAKRTIGRASSANSSSNDDAMTAAVGLGIAAAFKAISIGSITPPTTSTSPEWLQVRRIAG